LVFYIALDKVILIGGPTGSGKSAYAYKLAQSHNGIILNADSLQVYRGLEILTAQPSLEDQHAIPHRLYGVLDPSESCSAGRWLSLVIPEIQKALEREQLPIVVGGTGLYFKTLLEGISAIPSIAPDIREELQKRENLYTDLESVDPELASRLNPYDHQRIIRGLEVFYGTGKPLSFWQSQKPTPLSYKFEKILFMPPKEEVEAHLTERLEKMLEVGVLEEVSALLNRSLSINAKKAIGFKEFCQFLEGHCSLEEAKTLTLLHTRQYAKRQRTWFRHQFAEGAKLRM